MSKERGKAVGIYASQQNAARIEWAKGLDINVSAIVNGLFDKYLAAELEKARAEKSKQLRKALEAPMP